MQVVDRIYVGHKIIYGADTYEVVGSRKLRGTYFYVVRDRNMQKFSMRREIVLQGQREGEIMVTT